MAPPQPSAMLHKEATAIDDVNTCSLPRILAGSLAAGSIGTRAAELGNRLRMQPGTVVRKAAENNSGHRRRSGERIHRRRNRNVSRALGREAIDAGGNGGKSNGSKAVGLAQFDRADVARRQHLIFALASAVPDRADGMNHMPRG